MGKGGKGKGQSSFFPSNYGSKSSWAPSWLWSALASEREQKETLLEEKRNMELTQRVKAEVAGLLGFEISPEKNVSTVERSAPFTFLGKLAETFKGSVQTNQASGSSGASEQEVENRVLKRILSEMMPKQPDSAHKHTEALDLSAILGMPTPAAKKPRTMQGLSSTDREQLFEIDARATVVGAFGLASTVGPATIKADDWAEQVSDLVSLEMINMVCDMNSMEKFPDSANKAKALRAMVAWSKLNA